MTSTRRSPAPGRQPAGAQATSLPTMTPTQRRFTLHGACSPLRPATASEPSDALRREWRLGARDMAPLALGYVPFGLLVGTAVGRSPDPAASWAGTWTIYGGSAHLAVLDLLATLPTGPGRCRRRADQPPSARLRDRLGGPMGGVAEAVAAWGGGDGRRPAVAARRASGGGRGLPPAERAHYLGGGATLAGPGCWRSRSAPWPAPHSRSRPPCRGRPPGPALDGRSAPSGAWRVGRGERREPSTLVTRSWPAGSGLILSMAVAALAGLVTSREQARS